MKQNLLFNRASAICKRLAMVLTLLLTIGIGQAWGADYELVTSAPSDWSGEYLIVAGTSALSGGTSSWGTTTAVTVTNDKISTTANISVTISKGGTSGTYYIYMNSNSKYLKEVTSNTFATADASSTDTEWKITLSNGNAQIACASATTRYLRLNGTSGYRCYTSATGTLPKLYKKAASYTITAKSNNASYGTVSLSGKTITATPATGYRVSTTTPYTISPSGSATITQNGNTFTITPSANTTITINFEALPKYIVTLKDDNSTLTQSTAGATITLPSRDGCDGYEFVGWTKSWSVAQTTWTTTAPTIIPDGSYTPTANESLYPVYTKTEGGGSEPTAYSAGDVGSFIIASNVGNKWYAIPENPTLSSSKITGVEITVSQTAGGVKYVSTANAEGYTWKIANATNGQTISDGSKYIYHSNGGASGTNLTYGNSTSYTWKIEKETNGLTFKGMSGSTTNSRGLLFNGSVFGGYALSNEDASGYYRIQVLPIGGGSTTYYISVPDCITKTVVTLSQQGGTGGTESVTATYGQPMPPITIPTLAGYDFQGYFTANGGSGTKYYNADGTSARDWDKEDATFTLKAYWKAKTYTVTLDNQGATTEGATSVTATYNAAMPSIASNLPKKTGYAFQGYFDAISGGTKYYNADGTSAKNWDKTSATTLYAQWICETPVFDIKIKNDNPVIFSGETIELTVVGSNIAAGATYQWYKKNGESYDELTGQKANKLTIAAAKANDAGNYKCVVTNGTCSGENNYTVKMYHIKGLTDAAWEESFEFVKSGDKEGTFTIELAATTTYYFKLNDGSVWYWNEGTMTHNNCTDWVIEQEGADTQGKANTGITTTASGTYTFTLNYEDPSKPKLSVTYPQKKMVYLNPGNWNCPKYAVYSWDGVGNSTVLMTKIDDCAGRNIYQAEIDASHSNVIFIGGNASYNVANTWNNVSYQTIDLTYPSDDKVLYEINTTHLFLVPNSNWKQSNARFAAYFFGNGETWVSMTKVTADLYKVTIPTTKTYPSVIFCRMNPSATANNWNNKWNQSADLTITKGKNHYTIEEGAWDKGGGTWKTAGDWTAFTPNYTVTFDANGHGTAPADQCIAGGGQATQPTHAPTATGYTFGGWYKEAGCTNVWDFANDVVTSDITLYAKWTINTHTVTWKPAGGNWSGDASDIVQTYEYDELIEAPEKPVRTGYEFVEWTPAYMVGMTMPDENLEFTATWKFIPTLSWTAPSYTAALEADNDYPDLTTNPADLTGVTYSSSDLAVATIDANTGVITLVGVGETYITASFAGDGTYASAASATYTLNVVASNCRWVETDIANINSDDEVVIAMETDAIIYAMSINNDDTATPEATEITLSDLATDNGIGIDLTWYIEKDANEKLVIRPKKDITKNVYCNTSSSNDRVRVGKNHENHELYKTFEIEGNYLKNSGVYYIGVNISQKQWWGYANNRNIPGQTLKFYKRECLDSEHYWVTWDAGEGAWTDGSSKKLKSYQVGAAITAPTEEPTREGHRFDGWTPAPGNMPSENTTFTAKWTKVYKVTWYENGVPSYTYVPSDNAVVTWEDNIADCGDKKFYGWTADDTFVSNPTTPPTLISKGITITGDATYYAVYADAEEPANPGYTKVTTISEGTYLIATGETSSNKAYTGKYSGKTYGGTCDVVVENQVIKNKPNDALEVTVTLGTGSNADKFAIYDGTYYLSAPDDNALTFNNNIVYDWKLTADGYINSTGQSARYIQLNSSASPNRFACYSSNQKKAYLYKKQTTTYKNFAVSCATYTIIVTTPTGGTVTTTPADDAGAGQEITINVTPDDCKYLTALKYNDGSDHSINISSTSYTFTMPAADVTVTATFADKIATDIEILTSAHRLLMQGSAFVGEQVRITYNNGDKETLNWNDSRLTFTGHNTATLGSQTVTVTYNDCGTQSASYNIEVIDGLGITFWDGDYTETIKYEPGDLVDVDNRIGQNICSGWEFVGWSETKVANESNGFTPVHNFNATDAKVLYAVYVQTSTDWISAYNIDELHSGAKYVIIAHYSSDNEYALTNTSTTNASYLDGAKLTTVCEQVREGDAYPYKDRYKLKVTPNENWKWQLENTGSGWTMRNIKANKYLKVNTDKTISLTTTPDDKFTLSNGYNDSEITAQSSSNNYLSWYNSYKYWNGHTSGQQYYLTNETNFTSTPPCSPLSATFHGNGGIVTDGVNSGDDLTITEPTRDTGITTPTASFADCNGKTWTFVGWAREEIDVTRIPVLTTDLLHDGGGNKPYKIQEDGEEFWAVFTNTGNPETKYGTITFTDADVTRQYENAKTITKSVTAMGDYDFELYHVSNASSKGIQFDHEVATRGYIKNITSLGKINSISLNDFQTGDINDVKVYVGNTPNAINTLLTEADLQKTGNTYTYYPPKNYAYVKIEATGYCGITSISIDFGKGTQIWATTPNCSDIFLSGNELYVTSTKGQSIRAAERLTVKAVQLESKAKVVISSNCSDIYFSDVLDANFTQAVKPTETLTLTTNVDGNLSATEIYVHYRPSVDGTGIPEDVVVSANLETPNPSISDDQTIHVRNLPADFVIAAKWDGHWYALPANCTLSQSPTEGLLIEVDNIDDPKMAIAAPASAKFGLKSVYTSNSTNDRYEKNGANLVFVENVTEETPVANQTLYNGSETGIQVYAQYTNYHTGNALGYEWTPTTTNLLDYILTSAHTFTKTDGTPEEARTISLGNNGVFGTLLNDKSYNGEVRLLPATFYEPASAQVLKWKANSVIVMYTGTETTATTQVGDNAKSAEQTLANQQLTHGIYELTTNQSLTDHAGGELNIYIGTNTRVELEIPLIISGEVTASANAHDVVILENSKLTAAETKYSYKDVYVYGGAKLAIPENTELGVNNIILRAGGVATDGAGQNATYQYIYPQVELKGTLTSAVQNIRYEYVTDNDHWYHLVLPFDGSLASIHYPYEYYGDQVKLDNKGSWIIKRYDGATRATGNYDAWKDIEKDVPKATVVKAGHGYIYWGAPKKVTANGVYERPKWGIQRITMLSNVSETIAKATDAESKDKKISGLSSHKDVLNNSGNVYDQGWNLIGNPYMVNLTGLNSKSLKTGKLIEERDANGNWTGGWVLDSINATLRYITVPSDHFEWYTAEKVSKNMTLVAGRAFFVQIDSTATDVMFEADNRAQLMPALRAAHNDEPVDIETGIVLSNETQQDEVNFWIADGMTNDYEYNADYPKTPNNNNFNIYGVHTNGHLSWVAISPEIAAESMPIGYQVPAAGTYMLSVSEEYYTEEIDALLVTDHEMSPEVTTDLMSAPYEFSVNQAETNNKRFTVSVKLKTDDNNAATGLDNMGVSNEQLMKFIYQDKIYILHHGVIYDATGKRVITINK